EVEIWSSDKGSAKDIPEWVAKVGHEMAGVENLDGYDSIVVRKVK
ncbi:MAG: sulfurtransferase TusA family protein, partial [Alphaproteobacteria bacterium]|nr:sulfurtransferase TusA family protein [Alphaproteobacteria bacterium]